MLLLSRGDFAKASSGRDLQPLYPNNAAVMMLQDCTLFLILLSFALDRESMKKDVNRKDIMSVTSLLLRKLI